MVEVHQAYPSEAACQEDMVVLEVRWRKREEQEQQAPRTPAPEHRRRLHRWQSRE